jgi:hypothetical protein
MFFYVPRNKVVVIMYGYISPLITSELVIHFVYTNITTLAL